MDGTGKEALEDNNNIEGEDFLSQLTDEEKECLQYLLETIDSLEQDEDDNANHDNDTTTEQFRNLSESLPNTTFQGLSESDKTPDKAEHTPRLSKMRMVKSYSEDSPGLSITVSPETSLSSPSSHPSHLRKFDTIMRSGVNVQELRARFLHHQGSSPPLDDASRDFSSPSKHAAQMSRNPKSPRQEALQKLGLVKRNYSDSAAGQNAPEAQLGLDQHSSPGKNLKFIPEIKAGANFPHPVERKPGPFFNKIWLP